MVWKILSALTAVCLGTACYFAWANQKALVEERKREKSATENLVVIQEHKTKTEEAKKGHETLLAAANKDLETAKVAVVDISAKAQTKEQEVALVKTNLEQVTKVVKDLQDQIDKAGDIKALLAQIAVIKKDRADAEAALANVNQHFATAAAKVTGLTDAAKSAEEREARGRRGIVDDTFNAVVSQSFSDWGFVVLNKGNGGGVFANADLEVKRGKEVVAKLKVRDVEQNSSVADLVKGSLAEGERIRNGDRVVAAAEQSAKIAKGPATAGPAGAAAPPAAAGAPAAAPAMGSADPFGAPAAAPAMGAAPAAPPAMGAADPFGAPAAAAPAAPAAAPAMGGADPFGAAPPATPPAAPPAGAAPAMAPAAGATPPSTVDPFGTAPPPAKP